MIELTEVSKRYEGGRGLWPTSLTVDEGRCLALVGSSGSGKSTMLRLVLGLIAPDSGTVRVAGEVMAPARATALRLRIGYVIQDGGLFPHLTAQENAVIVAERRAWGKPRVLARLEALTDLVGLTREHLGRYPAELSGGERQRVGLMRSLMLDPPVLLLDEPLGSLDPIIRAKLQDDLYRIFRELKKTVLLVTHDIGEAAHLGDEIAILHDGNLVQKGTLETLTRRPAVPFVSEFLQAQKPRWRDRIEAP